MSAGKDYSLWPTTGGVVPTFLYLSLSLVFELGGLVHTMRNNVKSWHEQGSTGDHPTEP